MLLNRKKIFFLLFYFAFGFKLVQGRLHSRRFKSKISKTQKNQVLTVFPDDDALLSIWGSNFFDNNDFISLPVKKNIMNRNVSPDESCRSACVEPHFCKDGQVNFNGAGILTPKMAQTRHRTSMPCNKKEIPCCLSKYPEMEEEKREESPPMINDEDDKPQFSCGYKIEGIERRISGGESTHVGEFPWIIAILRRIPNKFDRAVFAYQGGGSLLHPRVVMTAAHIVNGRSDLKLILRAGEWNMQQRNEKYDHQDRTVSNIVIHNRFQRSTMANDIALLIVDIPFELTPSVNTICLPPLNFQTDPRTICTAQGWGKNSFDPNDKYKSTLEKIHLPIVASEECEYMFRNTRLGQYYRLDRSLICAGGHAGQDTCKGDGGSPLVCKFPNDSKRFYQTGIVAAGIGCASSLPGLYVNVPHFTDWIKNKMKLYSIYLNETDIIDHISFERNVDRNFVRTYT